MGLKPEQENEIEIGLDPIGVVDGKFVFPIFGAEPEDEDDEDEDDDSDDSDDEDDEDDDSDEDDDEDDEDEKPKKSKKKSKDEDDDEIDLWRGRANRYKARMEAADRRATTAERENRRLKRSKTDNLDEPGKQDLKDAQNSLSASQKTVGDLRLQVALLSDNTFQWEDPSLVLRSLSDSDDVEIDEDGKVSGVKQALKRLAKDKPFLVKKSDRADRQDDEDDEEDKGDRQTQQSPRTGSSTRRKKARTPDRRALESRYAALSARR